MASTNDETGMHCLFQSSNCVVFLAFAINLFYSNFFEVSLKIPTCCQHHITRLSIHLGGYTSPPISIVRVVILVKQIINIECGREIISDLISPHQVD